MKKIFVITLFLFSTTLISQEKASLILRNGDTLNGYSYARETLQSIKFQKEKDSKKVKYNYKQVKRVLFRNQIFDYKVIEGIRSTPRLYKLMKPGKVSLYRFDFTRTSNFNNFSMSNEVVEYSVCKNYSDLVTVFNASGLGIERSFRKKAAKFFKDCPELVEKIKSKTWRMKNIPEIVDYYNNNCSMQIDDK